MGELQKYQIMNRKEDTNGFEDAVFFRFYRSNGECICEICRKFYKDHELDEKILDWEGNPFLHVLCNGERVKL